MPDHAPRTSVCIDVFNYEGFLPRAIESALAQDDPDFEVIVSDDASSDDSFAIAREYERRDSRVRAIRQPENLGMIGNRNACLRLARGEFVKILHADDFFTQSHSLKTMADALQSWPGASVVACAMQSVDRDGRETGVISHFPGGRRVAGVNVIARCLREQANRIGGPSAVLFRRESATRGFDTRYFHAADAEMWFHLLETGCLFYLDEPLVAYRWHENQQTERDRATLSQADDLRALLATYLDKPYIQFKRAEKAFLKHDSVRRTLKRARKLARADAARAALSDYGARAYFAQLPAFHLLRQARKHIPPAPIVPERTPIDPRLPRGINVIGFFESAFGLGESARAYARATAKTGLPTTFVNVENPVHKSVETPDFPLSKTNPYDVNLVAFSFDYSRRFFKDRKRAFFDGRKNIAIWYWELEDFPARWHHNFDYYDEIWTPTDFCRDAFAKVSPIPVRTIPYPLHDPECDVEIAPDRARFGLTDSSFVALFVFDFFSGIARKNPLGVIEAFGRAFRAGDDATLLLKSINGDGEPDARSRVADAIDQLRARGLSVVWIETHLPGPVQSRLFASADAYVSLHRSEGLGLGMAQAMRQGLPTIATGYSGNLSFMTDANSYLVPFTPVAILSDSGPSRQNTIYEAGNVWAEPDIGEAAACLRRAFEDRGESVARGERARADIRAGLSVGATADAIRGALDSPF